MNITNINIVKYKIYDELNGTKDSDNLISLADRWHKELGYALNSSKIIKSDGNVKHILKIY